MPASPTKTKQPLPLLLLPLLAVAVRLALAAATPGYPYDTSCFLAWGEKLAAEGPAAFYSAGYFADYPPGYLPVLALVAKLRAAFGFGMEDAGTGALLALVPALCDGVLTWLAGHAAYQKLAPRTALCLTAFVAFCPLTLYNTAVWKQIDSAFALPLILCFILLEGKRYLPAALCYGVALAIKPQALLLGPVLAVCFLAPLLWGETLPTVLGRSVAGAAAALAVPLAAGLPFFGPAGLLPGLWEKYTATMGSYDYASINAFNWMAALGGNWQPLDAALAGPLRWEHLGWFHIAAVTLLLVFFAVHSAKTGRFSPLLLAGAYGAALFTVAHCMHERYMIPAMLLFLAAARWQDIRLYGAAFGLALTGTVNLATVYAQAGTEDEWLMNATNQIMVRLTGLAETACCLLLAFAVWDLLVRGHAAAFPKGEPCAAAQPPAALPRWQRREVAALLGLTAATAVLSFSYLGALTAPQNPVQAIGTVERYTVTVPGEATELWVYPGISGGGSLVVTDANGVERYRKPLDYGTCFCWTSEPFYTAPGEELTFTVENAQVFELSLRDGSDAPLAVQGSSALFDEPDAVPQKISQLNSMYFDEIYHARTGYEQLYRMPVYETTHPPLGKDLIMVGIALFGMTGFGWRCMGTLFGVLLVPLAWCFARRLTGKRWVGAVAATLLALDFMRFSQSRLATIDVYATFFILLGAHCMLWYCQSVLQHGVLGSFLPMMLGGAAFGLGCAAKWTGIYAGIGLAVLYLGVLAARWRQRPATFRREFRAAALGGVAFYVVLPLCIYVAAYLPYWWRDPGFGLQDWWNCQLNMFRYHSTLNATHPFESRWYTWLLGLRPVWYYQNTHLPVGKMASIAGLVGPVLAVGGLACLVWLLWRQVSGRGSRAAGAVLVLYATQLLPWVMVSRCTFLYHYFPSLMFCLAALALVLATMRDQRAAKRLGGGLCVVSAVWFVLFYPVLSGLPVPYWWADALKILPSYGFY